MSRRSGLPRPFKIHLRHRGRDPVIWYIRSDRGPSYMLRWDRCDKLRNAYVLFLSFFHTPKIRVRFFVDLLSLSISVTPQLGRSRVGVSSTIWIIWKIDAVITMGRSSKIAARLKKKYQDNAECMFLCFFFLPTHKQTRIQYTWNMIILQILIPRLI